MKAAVLERFGEVDAIAVREIERPRPGPGEALLEVRAAALNHLDIWVRRGARKDVPLPWVLGSDAAGVVAELGPGARGLEIGQEVVMHAGLDRLVADAPLSHGRRMTEALIGVARRGAFAQYVAVPDYCLHPKPAHLDFAAAAAICVDHLTAWRMVFSRAHLIAGESVLIHGIGGGVALAALQLVTAAGGLAIVTSSSDEKLARAREMSAAVGINYRTAADVADAVLAATDGRGVDVVIDSVGAATWPINFKAARRGGRIVHCGVTGGAEATADVSALYWKQLSVLGATLGSQEEFDELLRMMSIRKMAPVIDSTWPLEQIHQATERMEAGQQFGKIVLTVS
ncbi:MAG: zinc-binding dehydrogenase [Planctomycetaceae bacterium]|nr:zinc-binding dehydrogenase [Planctomycetaceae bacterium]